MLVLTLFAAIFGLAAHEIGDPDYWWHLTTGQWIVTNGTVPTADPFSHTSLGKPWLPHEWLPDVAFYLLHSRFGPAGPIVLSATLITLTHVLLYRLVRLRGAPRTLAVVVTTLAAAAGSIMWEVRPQLATTTLTVVFLTVLEDFRGGRRRRLWLLPPLMLVWANSHGGFLLGVLLCGAYLVGTVVSDAIQWQPPRLRLQRLGDYLAILRKLSAGPARSLFWTTLATAVAAVVTPYGWEGVVYPFGTLGSPAMQAFIDEWFSPDFHRIEFKPFEALLLLTVAALGTARRSLEPVELILLAGSAYMALESRRHIPFFAFVSAPILAQQLVAVGERWGWRPSPDARDGVKLPLAGLNLLLLAIVAGVLAWRASSGLSATANAQLQHQQFPRAAIEYIRASPPPGRMFNTYAWGGYLIWQLWPQQLVFIDGRADVHGDQLLHEYVATYGARGDWGATFDRHGVEWTLIERGSPLASVLAASPSWRRLYADDQAVIFVRQSR